MDGNASITSISRHDGHSRQLLDTQLQQRGERERQKKKMMGGKERLVRESGNCQKILK